MFLALLAQVPSASAAAGDYGGTYDLRCISASLGVDAWVSYNSPVAALSWPGAWSAEVPCGVSPRAMEAWARGVARDCAAAGLPTSVCRDFAINLYRAVLPYSDMGAWIAPNSVDLAVNTWSSPWALFGVYDTTFDLHFAHAADMLVYGTVQTAPADEGYFYVPGLTGTAGAEGSAACLGLSGGEFEGHVEPDPAGALVGHYGVGATLACAATSSAGELWTGGVTIHADVQLEGARRAPAP